MHRASSRVAMAAFAALAFLPASPVWAADADVVAVRTTRTAPDVYDFAVTVRSRDTGWQRYADRLEAVGPDGAVIATRMLDHPHDDEQPFTRDISGVQVKGTAKIVIRVHFKPSGFDGATADVALPGDAR